LELYLAVLGGLAVVIGLASRPLRRSPFTEPLLALAIGVVLGPQVTGLAELAADDEIAALHLAAELSLAISLMAVALRFTRDEIRPHLRTLLLLLTVVLIAMAALSAIAALGLLGLSAAGAWFLGAALAPTDPILASNVVSGDLAERDLPLRVRVLVSVESGANDALALALVAIGIAALLGDGLVAAGLGSLLRLGWGVLLGLAAGLAAGRALIWSERHRDIEHSAFLVLSVSLAFFVLGAVNLAGGSGLLAVFVAGLAYGHELSRAERNEEWEIQEAINQYLILPVFAMVGLSLPWAGWIELGWRGPAFVIAVLVFRRLPVLIVLRRLLELRRREAVFLGWFGPMGVAALFYLADASERGALDDTTWAAGTLVIAASTVAHGITAAWGRQRFADRGGAARPA
jgi:sodium/hydrogen antiporter